MIARYGVVLLQCLCVVLFFTVFIVDKSLTHQELHFDQVSELEVQLLQGEQEVPETHELEQATSTNARKKHFRVMLPTTESLMGKSILISGFRHYVEVKINHKTLLVAGSKKHRWAHNYSPILPIPLSIASSSLVLLENNNAPYLDIHTTAYGVVQPLIGQVWIGHDNDIQLVAERLRLSKFYIPFATFGILLALIIFLAIDSALFAESQKYFILTMPHLLYALICLPEPPFADSVLWFKLHYVSVIATALFWSHFGIKELGLNNKYLDYAIWITALMAVPYFFMSEATQVFNWGLNYHVKVAFAVGLAHYFYVGWKRPESNGRFKNTVFIIVGGFLAGAGAADIAGAYSSGIEIRDSLVPLVSLVMTCVILVITAVNMRRRGKQLLDHQSNMIELVNQRTAKLEETQAQLLQHQRFKTLNAMGSAISHEIKNPLAALKNDFRLITLKQKTKNFADNYPLERIDRNIHRIDNTLTVLTDYSKMQSIKTQRQNISTWLEELLAEEDLEMAHPDVQFSVNLESGLFTRFDPESLRRAVLNLMDNALNAVSEQSQQQICLTLKSSANRIKLTIEDSGPGFGSHDLLELCEPLVSGSATGLGLGLAIVSDIVKLHDGILELSESTKLHGAAATINLRITEH